jgi:BAI1-associated protein 3
MVPPMKRLLIEGAELFNQDSNSIDRLMMYVDNNLTTLHNELNEENFGRILEILWDNLGDILNEIIQSNIEVSRCWFDDFVIGSLLNRRNEDRLHSSPTCTKP